MCACERGSSGSCRSLQLRVICVCSAPILVLWGTDDPFTPCDGPVGRFFKGEAERRSEMEFVALEGVGHCPHDEVPDLVHQHLMPWLERHH